MATTPKGLFAVRRLRRQRNERLLSIPKALAVPAGLEIGRYVQISPGPNDTLTLVPLGPEALSPAPEHEGGSQTPQRGSTGE